MRTKVLLFAILFLSSLRVLAHPGVGIVMDSRGNIYYTDLKQVWRIAPDGTKSVAVRNVHTHELCIDAADNLYGEHLWYEGEATNKWGHRVWRLKPDGTLTDLIPARSGFLDDYDDFHFVRDGYGCMYWVDRGEPCLIRKRSPDGTVTSLATANFRDVRWMTVTSGGTVYLVDRHDLVRIAPEGEVVTMARDLADWGWTDLFTYNRHAVYGLWTDPQSNVYIAILSDRVVKRVSPDGRVEIIERTPTPWSPTGGLVAPNGDLWLLEYSNTNAARVRRIEKDGKTTVFD